MTEVRPGAVAVFPFTYYRRYAWNGDRVVLDPVPRLLDADVVANDDLPLQNGVVAGEDPRAARIRAGLDRGDDLARVLAGEGVRYVVVELDQPDIDSQRSRLRDLPVLWRAGDLALLRVPGATVPAPHRPPPVGIVLGGLTLLAAAGAVLLPRLRRRC